jgi:hypothetical protein
MNESSNSLLLKFPVCWNKQGKITARLAAKADAHVRYITTTMGSLVDDGLLPENHGLKNGDVFAVVLEGHFVPFKVNRKNNATSAAHLPKELELPTVTESGFNAKIYEAVVLGPMKEVQLVTLESVCAAVQDGTPTQSASDELIEQSSPAVPESSGLGNVSVEAPLVSEPSTPQE